MKFRSLAIVMTVLSLAGRAQAGPASGVTAVQITKSEAAGAFGGVAFRRIEGKIEGRVAASEPVAGLSEIAAGRAFVPYQTTFKLTLPVDPARADGIVVGANNRGSEVLGIIFSGPRSKPGAGQEAASLAAYAGTMDGEGFLLSQHLSIASIQWQTGLAPGVPEGAQGIGQVIVRDFGRWLGGAFPETRGDVPPFRRRILAAISQSAWFVNSFVAEGFNADPVSGRAVYQGVFTRNGVGNVLAINGFAKGGAQTPYPRPDGRPLTPRQMLTRPKSDPILVDVASLTDFYRVRASVFARAPGAPHVHRYATQAPHAVGAAALSPMVFGRLKCNGGTAIPLSTVGDGLYLRPLILALANSLGATTASSARWPAEVPVRLQPAPRDLRNFNGLAGTVLWTPRTVEGASEGGVPMLEAALPLGVPEPPAVEPVSLNSIAEVCGNFSGWRAFSAEELTRRYGSRAAYLAKARRQAGALVAQGYLLPEDEAAALANLESQIPASFQ